MQEKLSSNIHFGEKSLIEKLEIPRQRQFFTPPIKNLLIQFNEESKGGKVDYDDRKRDKVINREKRIIGEDDASKKHK